MTKPADRDSSPVAMALPLQGKTVLITRPPEQAEEFAQLLRQRGANVVFIPTIQIRAPKSWQECDRAIEELQAYDGFVFTSANAVQAFFSRLNARAKDPDKKEFKGKPFYAVGEKTGEALTAEGMRPTFFPNVNGGKQLAEAISQLPLRGKRFLFPHGNLASDELPAILRLNGVAVDGVTVYDTVGPSAEDADLIREELEREGIDIVTFFSPSSVTNLLSLVPLSLISSKIIAVIGVSTETAARGAGLTVHIVAPNPASATMADAIAQYFKE